ncbi:MAG: ABC transporter ATP-binding protein [Treponema sp.]|jgi:oligopeptide transport system ATP-binding protein|nr:ABC transporter ATP-binding protein [Treponema sp.]
MKDTLLEVKDLKKYYKAGKGRLLKALDGVSFSIAGGQTFGLVGESGCGKTTCGRTAIGLLEKSGGMARYRGKDVHAMTGPEKKALSREAQIIFQDPYASLDPRMTIMDIVAEGLDLHRLAGSAHERRDRVFDLLRMVGLNREHAGRYAHELSGGQRQRIGIARALAVNPRFILCDEPISALDVSVQAQIVNLLMELQQEMGLTYLFISHDLAMVKYISDAAAVMYLGVMVEMSAAPELYAHPAHPYTKALLSAIPDPEFSAGRERIRLAGEAPNPVDPPPRCRFYGRCPLASSVCGGPAPELREIAPGHYAACHRI